MINTTLSTSIAFLQYVSWCIVTKKMKEFSFLKYTVNTVLSLRVKFLQEWETIYGTPVWKAYYLEVFLSYDLIFGRRQGSRVLARKMLSLEVTVARYEQEGFDDPLLEILCTKPSNWSQVRSLHLFLKLETAKTMYLSRNTLSSPKDLVTCSDLAGAEIPIVWYHCGKQTVPTTMLRVEYGHFLVCRLVINYKKVVFVDFHRWILSA